MKKLNYFLFLAAVLLFASSCQEENAIQESVVTPASTELTVPSDAPEFVLELQEYLKNASQDEVEGRSDELSIYRYLCFKPDLSIFKTVVESVRGLQLILDNPLLPATVFAPTNDAFVTFLADNGFASLEEVPQGLLNQVVANHIILGRKDVEWLHDYMKTLAYADCEVRGRLNIFTEVVDPNNAIINGMVNIVRGNQFVGRGFVHVVDKVIAPSTIVDFVASDSQFSTLLQAVTCPSLQGAILNALTAEGAEFTLFAPTNEAFDDLAAALGVSSVCDIPAETLATVLAYHVKPASLAASTLARGFELKTLADGLTLRSELDGTQVKIVANASTATVIAPNLQANNGVVHGIDTVLLP
ncbi:MAG: fasciclin domain-containing protein [Bacteroidota bacterium]